MTEPAEFGSRLRYRWDDDGVGPGKTTELPLVVSESYSGVLVTIPVVVRRAVEDGPTVFITAAIHGDELNGTGAIREIIWREPNRLRRGTLVLIPVANILGFERHSRYLPDRRDLNRCFPGRADGSMSAQDGASDI